QALVKLTGVTNGRRLNSVLLRRLALEERENRLRVAVGDLERLDAELLLDLQGLEAGRFLVHVGIDELADAALDRVHQAGGEFLLQVDLLLGGAEQGGGVGNLGKRLVGYGDHLGDLRVREADDRERRDGVTVGGGNGAGGGRGRGVRTHTR